MAQALTHVRICNPNESNHQPRLMKDKEIEHEIGYYLRTPLRATYSISKESRYLQNLVNQDAFSSSQITQLLYENMDDLDNMIQHVYGNYVFNVLMSKVHSDLYIYILYRLRPKFHLYACHEHATRCIQFIVTDSVNYPNRQPILICNVLPFLAQICTNVYGNHVIQGMLRDFHSTETVLHPLFASICDHLNVLIIDRFACPILRQCIAIMPMKFLIIIYKSIQSNFIYLSQHENANYVVQYLIQHVHQQQQFNKTVHLTNLMMPSSVAISSHDIEKCIADFQSSISSIDLTVFYNLTVADFIKLSTNKISSLVVECLLEHGTESQQSFILQLSLSNFNQLLHLQYGIFILRKIVLTLPPQSSLCLDIMASLLNHHMILKQSNVGIKLLQELFEKYPIIPQTLPYLQQPF